MGFIEGIASWLIHLIMNLIQAGGFVGVFGLMTLESMCLPIPSEIILSFGGALASMGEMSVSGNTFVDATIVGLVGTLGCTVGSIISYSIGLKGGRPLILKYGRYVRITEKKFDSAESWFKLYGDKAVFYSRLLPVIRTFISIPAGTLKMNFKHFVTLTTLGSLPWCMALTYMGYYLGKNWKETEFIYRILEIGLIIVALILIGYWLWHRSRVKHEGLDKE